MRLHNFYIENKIGDAKELVVTDPSLLHQMKNVFRFHVGDLAVFLDNSGFEYVSELVTLERAGAMFHVREKLQNNNVPKREVFLFQALVKKDKFEWILEKGTEIGVTHFVPLIAERSEKKDLNIERCKKIIVEASEQSHRGILPRLYDVYDWEKSLDWNGISYCAFHPEGQKINRDMFAGLPRVGVLVGPEGGWTENELQVFRNKNVPIYSLGPQIMRSETAALVISSLLLLDF